MKDSVALKPRHCSTVEMISPLHRSHSHKFRPKWHRVSYALAVSVTHPQSSKLSALRRRRFAASLAMLFCCTDTQDRFLKQITGQPPLFFVFW